MTKKSTEKLADEQKPSGPITLSNGWTVHVDRDLCIGAATCVLMAPFAYNLDDEAKAVLLESIINDNPDDVLEGAKSCPVDAIIIKDEKGTIIYPS